MVFKKKTEREKEIAGLRKRLSQIDEQIDSAFEQSRVFAEKGESGKSTQATTRWAILIDKRKIINEGLNDLLVQGETGGDKTLEFSEKTAELFLKWLEKEGKGWFCYLHMIRFHPNVLEKILQEEVKKEISLEDLEKSVVEQYCKKNNLEIRKKE